MCDSQSCHRPKGIRNGNVFQPRNIGKVLTSAGTVIGTTTTHYDAAGRTDLSTDRFGGKKGSGLNMGFGSLNNEA